LLTAKLSLLVPLGVWHPAELEAFNRRDSSHHGGMPPAGSEGVPASSPVTLHSGCMLTVHFFTFSSFSHDFIITSQHRAFPCD